MNIKYKIRNQDKLYFVTFTSINWIEVYVRSEYLSCKQYFRIVAYFDNRNLIILGNGFQKKTQKTTNLHQC